MKPSELAVRIDDFLKAMDAYFNWGKMSRIQEHSFVIRDKHIDDDGAGAEKILQAKVKRNEARASVKKLANIIGAEMARLGEQTIDVRQIESMIVANEDERVVRLACDNLRAKVQAAKDRINALGDNGAEMVPAQGNWKETGLPDELRRLAEFLQGQADKEAEANVIASAQNGLGIQPSTLISKYPTWKKWCKKWISNPRRGVWKLNSPMK